MQPSDLQNNAIVQTAAVAEATKDPETMQYIQTCLRRFFSGQYGQIDREDVEANLAELKAGEGHVLAKYEARGKLDGDIFIDGCFSASRPGDRESNHTTVMYCKEY